MITALHCLSSGRLTLKATNSIGNIISIPLYVFKVGVSRMSFKVHGCSLFLWERQQCIVLSLSF